MVQISLNTNPDKMKELIELSIQCGRHLQSAQTGYVHYYYSSINGEAQQTIPILENVLFILALFRSKLVDNMTEAKNLLERILAFQNNQLEESKGNFPTYLHEYPQCRDRLLGIHLLAPFYWILKNFGHILGQPLKRKLEQSIQTIFVYGNRLDQKLELPYSMAMRFAAAKQAFGLFFANEEWIDQGQIQLNQLLELGHVDSWHSTEYLADLLVALQMVYPSIQESPWKSLWHYINRTWQFSTNSYVGPCVREEQRKEEPLVGLYDFFLSMFTRQEAARTKSIHPSYLQISLIQQTEDKLENQSFPITVEGMHRSAHWKMIQQEKWACTVLEKQEGLHPNSARTYTPFRFVWGDLKKVHTLVYQAVDETTVSYTFDEVSADLIFHLGKEVELDSRERQREVSFYFDFHPEVKIRVEGKRSSTFELGQTVTIESEGCVIALEFKCIEGKGQFLGHLMRGNRPSQLDVKGENRFKSYDWVLFVRSIRREENCALKAKIRILS